METQSSQKLPSSLSTIQQAFEIYRKNIKTYIGISALPLVLSLALVFLPTLQKESWLTPLILVLGLLLFIIKFWADLAFSYSVNPVNEGKSAKLIFLESKKYLGSYLWLYGLSWFITTGLSVFVVIPGLIASIWFSFSNFILLNEDLRGMNALLKSREYVRGNWWAVFSRYILISFPILFVLIPVGSITNSLKIGDFISPFILWLFVMPFLNSFNYLLWTQLKAIKGDFVFAPSKKTKFGYIFLATLGFLLLIALLVFVFITLANVYSNFQAPGTYPAGVPN